MAGTMSQEDLVADLQRSLHDAAGVFSAPGNADWLRFLATALTAMQNKRPRTLLGTVTLVADTDTYPLALADFASYKTHQWGGRNIRPWLPEYPGALPRVTAVQSGDTWSLVFDPAPTMAHLQAYGSTFRFWYFGLHALGATPENATLAAADRPLLLLRAQAEAMRELAMRNINKPVALRDGISGTPRNSTPSALYQQLLAEWEAAR
jgi:hypothetical protein